MFLQKKKIIFFLNSLKTFENLYSISKIKDTYNISLKKIYSYWICFYLFLSQVKLCSPRKVVLGAEIHESQDDGSGHVQEERGFSAWLYGHSLGLHPG